MANGEVELRIGGQVYAGWDDVGVTRAMDACAGTFSLSVTDRWYGQDQPWPISPGDTCELRVDGEVVITGYVDAARPSYTATSHSIQVQGRDKSADMIDCSAVHHPDEWRNITLLQLANTLAGPFSISVRAEADTGEPIPLAKLNHGETALEALLRYSRIRKVLVMPDGKGGILLTRTGRARAAVELVQGQNILEASGTMDWSERYSEYTVKGNSNFSEDHADGATESHVIGHATDAGVNRYRPLIVVADCDVSDANAEDRAVWEANTRLGKSTEASITVQGWRQDGTGPVWQPNMLVRVRSDWLRMDGEMLIRQVTFRKGAAGTTTTLDLVSPQAYAPEPPDKRTYGKKAKKGKGGNPWMSAIGEDVRNG